MLIVEIERKKIQEAIDDTPAFIPQDAASSYPDDAIENKDILHVCAFDELSGELRGAGILDEEFYNCDLQAIKEILELSDDDDFILSSSAKDIVK